MTLCVVGRSSSSRKAACAETAAKVWAIRFQGCEMEGCFIEFSPPDDSHVLRTIECVNHVAALKRDEELDEESIARALREEERAYFRALTPEELSDWNHLWFSTPLPQRHSPNMPTPGWDLGSMAESIADAEFEISGVTTEQGRYYLTFEPESYPFGGTGCLVALLQCLGNQVLSVNNGTGAEPHVEAVRWEPRHG